MLGASSRVVRNDRLVTNDCPKLRSKEFLRLEGLSRPLHDPLHNSFDSDERRISLRRDFDFPLPALGPLQRVTIARAVDSVARLVGKARRDNRGTSLDSALADWRKEMNRLDVLSADLVGNFLQEAFCSFDHV